MDETRNYLLWEISHNDLRSKNYKETCKYLNNAQCLLILVSTITGCVSISFSTSLSRVSVGITSLAIGLLKIWAINAGTKKDKSIIKKKKN